jgi:serine/threonine protein kinase/tetratricopeptide (TPR) repeat protein
VSLEAGTRLGPYLVLGPLGAGGMGEVYRARDERLEREVAIKVLPERLRESREALARFEREAKAVAALSHPGVLTLFDIGTEGGLAYAVTELLEGETLRVRLATTSLPWPKAVEIAAAVADGMAAAHQRGIVHRDLKPENIFLTTDGRVKILDFGLARIEPAFQASTVAPTLTPAPTEPGTVMGTVGYMSPEQVRGQEADARSDIFSFGCVLYELVTGTRAFRATTGVTIAAILRDEPADPAGSGKPIPADLSRLIVHCLEKNADERFQSFRDLAFGLRAVMNAEVTTKTSSGGRRPIDSLAVLPFANQSGDPDAEYLSDGIAESILQALSRLSGLRVMARTTLSRYRHKDVDPLEVGRELSVRGLVTGRVFHRGESLAVKCELVDTRDGSLLWAETYNRKLSDILEIEEEISREISEKLRLRITGEEAEGLARRATESTEAHRLYLRGSFFMNKRSAEGLLRGIADFQKAIEEDPGYALPYAGIAECYDMLGFYGHLRPSDAFPKAKAAATRALQLDAKLAEARAALGVARFYYDRDWPAAEAEFRRAIADRPAYAAVHQFYGIFLAAMGRFDEAEAEVARAEEADPLSLPAKTSTGFTRFIARRYEASVIGIGAALEIDPTFVPLWHVLIWSQLYAGAAGKAIEAGERAAELSGRAGFFVSTLAYAYAASGKADLAREALTELAAIGERQYLSAYQMALIHLALGDRERAFELLETAFRDHDWQLVLLRSDPRVDAIRQDPRFPGLLVRAGL